jgi:phage terminase large subunit GpA-like protein
MDRGAVVAWPERFKSDELSALQHAMNQLSADKRAFHAEYQNEPLEEQLGEGQLSAEVLAARLNGIERGKVPIWATHLTAFIDVQKTCLWWIVAAWSKDFTGAVVDYGTWPDQQRAYFTLQEVQRTLARECPASGLEATLLHGLKRCSEHVLQRDWLRQDGGLARVEKLLIDANWGESTNTIYEFCRTTPHAALVVPSHGKGITADQKPMSEYQRKPGEMLGIYWYLTAPDGMRGIRHLIIDTNWWKSFVAERLTTAVGDKGALTLPGQKGTDHRMLCDHLAAEYRTPTQGRGRRVDVWKIRPNRIDNHWFDGLTCCAVGASMLGCTLLGNGVPMRRKVSFEDCERHRREFEARRAREGDRWW